MSAAKILIALANLTTNIHLKIITIYFKNTCDIGIYS